MPGGYVLENGIWRSRTACLDHYDSEYLQRACALWTDPRFGPRYHVLSGSRSFEKQKELYDAFRAGKGNPANKPGTSKHEWTKSKGAAAMDIHPISGYGGSYAAMHTVAQEYGFTFPIRSEDWHMQLDPRRRVFKPLDTPASSLKVNEETEMPQCEWDDGAVAHVNAKGEVFCPEVPGYPTAKHFGGMPNLRADAKRTFSGTVTCIRPVKKNDSQAGYVVLDESWGFNGEFWKFEPGVEKFFKR